MRGKYGCARNGWRSAGIRYPSSRSLGTSLGKARTEFGQIPVGSAEKCAPAQQALEVKMCIVLPGVADTAEYLDGGIAHGGQSPGERLRAQRGKMAFVIRKVGVRERVGGPERVDHAAAGQFDRLVH